MAAQLDQSGTISATEIDAATLQQLHTILTGNAAPHLVSDTGEAVAVPPALLTILRTMLGSLEKGLTLQVQRAPETISYENAAEYLSVSSHYVLQLIHEGVIHEMSNGQLALADVVKYQHEQAIRTHEGIIEIARLSQEAGAYD